MTLQKKKRDVWAATCLTTGGLRGFFVTVPMSELSALFAFSASVMSVPGLSAIFASSASAMPIPGPSAPSAFFTSTIPMSEFFASTTMPMPGSSALSTFFVFAILGLSLSALSASSTSAIPMFGSSAIVLVSSLSVFLR